MTGVQTCALPICVVRWAALAAGFRLGLAGWRASVTDCVPASDDFLVRVGTHNVSVLGDGASISTLALERLRFNSLLTELGCPTILLFPPVGPS